MALCTHEHPYAHWQFQIDKDEFLACSSPDVRDTDVLMVRIICLFSSHSVISLLYINPSLFLPSSPLRRIYCGLIQTPLGIGPKKLKQRSFSTRYCVGLVVTCRLSVQQIWNFTRAWQGAGAIIAWTFLSCTIQLYLSWSAHSPKRWYGRWSGPYPRFMDHALMPANPWADRAKMYAASSRTCQIVGKSTTSCATFCIRTHQM